jgi:hypothetical protein
MLTESKIPIQLPSVCKPRFSWLFKAFLDYTKMFALFLLFFYHCVEEYFPSIPGCVIGMRDKKIHFTPIQVFPSCLRILAERTTYTYYDIFFICVRIT